MLMLGLALLLAAEPIPRGAAGKTVAVLEFDSQLPPTDTVDRIYFSDKVRGEIARLLPQAMVMTRENLVQLLGATGKKLEDCTGECEVETGRMLGADLVVSGRLTKVGTRFKLSLRFHSTKDGALISTATASGETVDKLDDATADAVSDLVASIAPPVAARPPAQGGTRGPPPTLLIVESVPSGARVLLDGNERGTAPLSLEGLAAGRHQLRLELPDYQFAEQEVTVLAAQTSKARVALQRLTGRLTVDSTVAARCAVAGQERPIASGGLELFELPVGDHQVVCTASGYQSFTESVTVKAGQTAKAHARLEAEVVQAAPSHSFGPGAGANALRTIAGVLLLGGGGALIALKQDSARGAMTLLSGAENRGPELFAASLLLGIAPHLFATALWKDEGDLGVPFALAAGAIGGVTTAATLGLWFAGQDGAKVSARGPFSSDHWMIVGGSALAATGTSLLVQAIRKGLDLAPEPASKPKAHALMYALGGAALVAVGGLLAAQRLEVARGNYVPNYDGDTFSGGAWIGLGALGSCLGGALTFGGATRSEGIPWIPVALGTAAGGALSALVSGTSDWTFAVGMGLVGSGVGLLAAAVSRGSSEDLARNDGATWAPTMLASRATGGLLLAPGIAGRF